jgi:hypothetical protein
MMTKKSRAPWASPAPCRYTSQPGYVPSASSITAAQWDALIAA